MKKIFTIIFTLVNGLIFSQLTVSNALTPEQLVQNILAGSGVTISNVTYTGTNQQIGTFNGVNSNIGFNSGLILTTGEITNAIGPNNTGAAGTGLSNPGDADLDAIIFDGTNDACVLEFDFIPISDTVVFNYVFASEEYMEWVNSGVNDGFGFFISGPGINGPFSNNSRNIALIPGTTQFVTIDDVNANSNAQFYVDNENPVGQSVQYDGFTRQLQAVSQVICGETYHLKIVIADGGDDIYDSGVFLQAGSLISVGLNIDLSTVTGDSVIYEQCTDAQFIFSRPESMLNEVTIVNYVLSGTAIEGVDYNDLPDFIEFPIGEDTVIVTLTAFQDGILEGNETVIITATYTSECGDVITLERTLTISEEPIFAANTNAPIVFCPSDTIDMIVQAIGGTPPYIYTWDIGGTPVVGDTVDGSINGVGTETYNVDIIDFCGFTFQSSVTITQENPVPLEIFAADVSVDCTQDFVDLFAFTNGGVDPVEISWSNGETGNFIFIPVNGNEDLIVTARDACNNEISETVSITILGVQPITINLSAPLATCVDITVPMTATTVGGQAPISISWSNGLNGSTVNGITAGGPTYTATATDLCGSTISETITIQFAPDPTIIINAQDISIQCPDPAVNLSALASGGFAPYTYAWNTGLAGPSITVPALTNGTQTFAVTATDVCGNTATEDIVLNLNQTFRITTTSQTPSVNCAPTGTTNVLVAGETGNVNYVWNGPGTTGPIVSNIQTAQNLSTGWYYVNATDNVCFDSDSVFVNVLPQVVASFTAGNLIGELPHSVTFTNTSQNATTFDWDFGNNTFAIGVNQNEVIGTYTISGDYTIELIAYQGPCSDTAFINITILSEPTVQQANIFTPNGDKSNDGFTLHPKNFKSFTMLILNRWGNVVFEGDAINNTWNGLTTSGNEASEGTYFYEYTGEGLNNKTLQGHGFFQLVRN